MKNKKKSKPESVQIQQSQQELIRFDWAMKRLLRQKANYAVLEGFLSALFNENMKIVSIKESESNKQHAQQKFNRVDIIVENNRGELLIIEMQSSEESDYFLRMLFGASKSTAEHLKKGSRYSTMPKVYHINIVYFRLGVGDDYIYRGITEFRGLHTGNLLHLTKEQKDFFQKIRKNASEVKDLFPEYYILCVADFDNVAKDSLDEWMYFLKNNSIPDEFTAPGLAEAKEQLRYNSLSKQEQIDYDQHVKQILYEQEAIDTATRKGERKGIAKGKAERDRLESDLKAKDADLKAKDADLKAKDADLKAKDADLKAKNAELAIKDEKTAIKLQQKGMSPEDISEITGLSLQRIQQLKKN